MRGLFSMMFGASTMLVIESAVASARSPAGTHYMRMLTLMMFGLVHFYLIWWGDILFLYSMTGMLLFMFRNLSVKALRRWAIGFLTFSFLLFGFGMSALRLMGGDEYRKFIASFAPGWRESVRDLAIYQGDYLGILNYRMVTKAWEPLSAIMYIPETLGLMLIGMALYKSGLFSGSWDAARLARWRNRGLAFGLIGNIGLLAWQFASGFDAWVVLTSTLVWSLPFDIAMSIGYAAAFMGLAQRFAGAPLILRVAATGRAAFSNYLGTSILMTTIFYGYGLGLYGHVPRAALYLFVAGAWVLMLLWSKPWLDRFHYGPLEWLWRCMARMQMQPLRRHKPPA
jgi:uncharacterized protein